MNEHYLGVCIPYRDSGDGVRKKHLDTLVPYLTKSVSYTHLTLPTILLV